MSEYQTLQIKSHKRILSLCIVILLNKERKNDLEVAHPHCGSSTTIPGWIGVWKSNIGFWGKGKARVLREKHLAEEERTNNKLNPHICMVLTSGTELKPHRWEVNALTTEASLASQQISAVVRHFLMKFDLILYLSYQSMSQVITYRRKGDHKSITLIMLWTGFAIFWAL